MTLRVLHTADWHLGDRLGGQDRLPDQLARLEELMAHAEEHLVDALLVCGDVLEETRPPRLADIIAEVAGLLRPSVDRGMQCVFLAGNHDSQHTFALFEGVQQLLAFGGSGGIHFVSTPALLPLTVGGEPAASLIALPYPTAAAYSVDPSAIDLEQKAKTLQRTVDDRIKQLSGQADEDFPGLPKLMAGHFLLRKVPAQTGDREVAESEDIRIEGSRLRKFAYVALGHVHKPTELSEHVRYSGALDRIDFGEAGEARGAILVEFSGDEVDLQQLALDPTPMAEFEIGKLAEIAEKAEQLEDPEATIVKLTLRVGRDDSAGVWLAEARDRFPRLFKPPTVDMLDDPLPSLLTGQVERADPVKTVKGFLSEQLEGDPDRDELLAFAGELLKKQARAR